jgi:hypothetical protein
MAWNGGERKTWVEYLPRWVRKLIPCVWSFLKIMWGPILVSCVGLACLGLLARAALAPVHAPPPPRFVASLTTIGGWDCTRTVASLLGQVGGPPLDAVYVVAFGGGAEGRRAKADARLLKLDPARVRVLRPASDYGPASKLVAVLAEEPGPETRILLVDDDRE